MYVINLDCCKIGVQPYVTTAYWTQSSVFHKKSSFAKVSKYEELGNALTNNQDDDRINTEDLSGRTISEICIDKILDDNVQSSQDSMTLLKKIVKNTDYDPSRSIKICLDKISDTSASDGTKEKVLEIIETLMDSQKSIDTELLFNEKNNGLLDIIDYTDDTNVGNKMCDLIVSAIDKDQSGEVINKVFDISNKKSSANTVKLLSLESVKQGRVLETIVKINQLGEIISSLWNFFNRECPE